MKNYEKPIIAVNVSDKFERVLADSSTTIGTEETPIVFTCTKYFGIPNFYDSAFGCSRACPYAKMQSFGLLKAMTCTR